MTESALFERISEIRGEIIELITTATAPAVRQEVRADLVVDDLLIIANRLGRLNNLGPEPPAAQS